MSGDALSRSLPLFPHLSTDTNAHSRLEERRKVKSAAYYERKKAARRHLAQAHKDATVDKKTQAELAKYGY